jgi:hypothetical protein
LKKEKMFMLLRMRNAAEIGDDLYRTAIDEFQAAFPDSAAAALVQIDVTFLRKDWAGLAKTLDALDKQVGGDPFLDFYRGQSLIAQGKVEEAKKTMAGLIKKEPRIAAPYYTLIDVSLDQKDYATTARLLGEAEQNLGLSYADAGEKPGFTDFAASPEGKKFFAARRAPATPSTPAAPAAKPPQAKPATPAAPATKPPQAKPQAAPF